MPAKKRKIPNRSKYETHNFIQGWQSESKNNHYFLSQGGESPRGWGFICHKINHKMETNQEKAQNWGGARRGAGRPKKFSNNKTIALRIPEDVVAVLDTVPNRSAFIIEAIRHYVECPSVKK